MATVSNQIETYSNEINSICVHAKSIGFDIVNGDIMELMKSWLRAGSKLEKNISENKLEVVELMKWFIK